MKLVHYCSAATIICLLIGDNSDAQNKSVSDSANNTPVKLHGKVDVVFGACAAAGISISANTLPTVIDKVRLGSSAYYGNVVAGDKIISAQLTNNRLCLVLERGGQKFSVNLATVPIDQNMDSEQMKNNEKTITAKRPLVGEIVYGQLADVLIKQFNNPNNKELKVQRDSLQRQTKIQVESNGGQWHIASYYSEKPNDPRYLLCEGVRFYAIGDSKNAQRLFEEVIKHFPENGDAYYNLGALCENKKEFALAASYYKLALKYKPFDLEIKKAVDTVGQFSLVNQGGAFDLAISMKDLHSSGLVVTDTCNLCQILRNGAMHGG